MSSTQCGNFSFFSINHILREINFGKFESWKTAIFAILGALKMINLIDFSLQKVLKCKKIKIQALKMALFGPLKSPTLVSRKI